MNGENRSSNRVESFGYALRGFLHALSTQRNFQIQVLIGFLSILAGFYFNFTPFEWIVLVLTIGLVLTAELLNTVIEVVVDLAVKEQLLPDARLAKDVAAAAVLLMASISVVVGIILFWPHLALLFNY